ncbi:MAG: hypothetical protein QOE58_1395 [Actinomycetota bacterium]|jgi:hypothetical protein|nr:hypothetical protein [Actinomycetota bacterium]
MPVLMEVSRRLQRTRSGSGRSLPSQLCFPLGVYLITRAIAAGYMVAAASPGRSGYADVATAWDGGWYRTIATQGYPATLPLRPDGQIGYNPWAFSPAYPLLVRAVMAVTGRDFSFVAPTLSLVLGAAAMVVLFVLVDRAVSRFSARATIVLTCTFMAAPVMQIAYSESLALLLVASAMLLLRERKYLAVAILLLALALTRPVVLAFVPVVIAHGISRWRAREAEPFSRKDQRNVVLLTGWCFAASGVWPVIVAVCVRDPLAWTKTQGAWRLGPQYGLGVGWPAGFLHHYGWPALAALVVIVLLTLGIALRPGAKAWGPELRAWAITYPGFLLLVTVPVPSVIRWMLLAFPLLSPFPEAAATRSEWKFRIFFIAAMALVGLAMQWVWISTFLAVRSPSEWYP